SPAGRADLANVRDRTPVIMAAALDPQARDPLCREALHLFVSILGAEAGNLTLTVLATGGVYISGGIPPRILQAEATDGRMFMAAFQAKGRLSPLLANVPVHIIVEPVALLGAAVHGLAIVNSPGGAGVRSRRRPPKRPDSTSSASTPSALCRWTPSSRRPPAPPARRWLWRRSCIACGSASCASIRSTPSGRTATGSCSRPATPRCCCPPSCT